MNEHDFEQAVRRHQSALDTYALALCSDREFARDAVQETLLRAWQYLHTYRADGSFEGWLLAICRRCVIDLASRSARLADTTDEFRTEGDHDALVAASGDGAVEVLALLAQLSLPAREVIVLCGWLGYDYEAAAQILDVPVGTVRSRLHRARRDLAMRLAAGAEIARPDSEVG